MRVAVFSQYHTSPDCPATSRHYTLLAELARHHHVTLLTTPAWRGQQLTHEFSWVPPGVELVESHIAYENRMGPARRALAFAQYAAWAWRAGRRLAKPDVVWGISTPLTAAWAAARSTPSRLGELADGIRGLPWGVVMIIKSNHGAGTSYSTHLFLTGREVHVM